MNDTELENLIRSTIQQKNTGSVHDFTILINNLESINVTKNRNIRYTIQTTTSNISNKIKSFFNILVDHKYLVLVPSLVLVFIIGAFSLSPQDSSKYNKNILTLAEQNETLDETLINDEDDTIKIFLETPYITEIDSIQNEI